MGEDRTALDMDFDDLGDFEPKPPIRAKDEVKRDVDRASAFPSRGAPQDAQLNMKGRKAVLDRFKGMCKDDRRSYVDMLEILMDRFEEGRG